MKIDPKIWRVLCCLAKVFQWEVYEEGVQQILHVVSDDWMIGWPVNRGDYFR